MLNFYAVCIFCTCTCTQMFCFVWWCCVCIFSRVFQLSHICSIINFFLLDYLFNVEIYASLSIYPPVLIYTFFYRWWCHASSPLSFFGNHDGCCASVGSVGKIVHNCKTNFGKKVNMKKNLKFKI